jgi:hypothetical protein
MIIVKLQGGLGNQLFQYAAGLALAERHGTVLKADFSFLKQDSKGHYTQRAPELHHFKLDLEEASASDLQNFNLNEHKICRRLKKQFPTWFKTIVFNESRQDVEPRFFNLPANTYLNGYWQSEAYFISVRDLLLKRLIVREQYLNDVNTYLTAISESTESVAIHVRRGDYVTLTSANQFHGVCGLEYYEQAVSHFSGKAHLFIFSDDLGWCQSNFQFKQKTTFVSTANPYSDFHLMKTCQHQIIANSSFSWWAAWLNTHSVKTVIAPKTWFANPEIETKDVYPNSWICL